MQAMIPTNSAGDMIEYARLYAKTGGDPMAMVEVAKASPTISERLRSMIAKAAVGVDFEGTTGYRSIAAGFIESLRNFACFDRMLGDNAFRRVPIQTLVRVVTLAPTGAVVGRGKAKPISRLELGAGALERLKSSAIVVLTKELLDGATAPAMQLFSTELRRAVAAATDADFFATILGSPTNLNTITSTGVFWVDLASMISELPSTGSTSKLYLILASDVARMVTGLHGSDGTLLYPEMSVAGGFIGKLPVLVSDELAAGSALLIDADGIAADTEEVRFATASHASLQMDDAPADAAANLVSLWQTNSRALRAERFFGVEVMRWNVVSATNLIQLS